VNIAADHFDDCAGVRKEILHSIDQLDVERQLPISVLKTQLIQFDVAPHCNASCSAFHSMFAPYSAIRGGSSPAALLPIPVRMVLSAEVDDSTDFGGFDQHSSADADWPNLPLSNVSPYGPWA
jgi:hypothetical protein